MDIQPIANSAPKSAALPEGGAPPAAPKAAAPVQTAAAVQQPASVPSMEQLTEAVKHINKNLPTQGVEFAIDSDTERTVVKVIDQGTKEVLRQIPSEEVLSIAKALDKLQGLLIKHEA